MDTKSRSSLAGIALQLLLVLLATAMVMQDLRPEAVGIAAPDGDFSSARAMLPLQEIARQPHPIGSEDHDRVRDYLVEQLNALGVECEIQPSLAWRQWGAWVVGARIDNVLGRLRGTGDGSAILLAAHYDSVDTGPGASDDGVGVAAILETVRALAAGPPLRNDVIMLLSDAEEIGLLGALAFVENHPWIEDVALVLNLEARGVSGETLMFQTAGGSSRLVPELKRAAPYPVASSLTYDVYRLMPNDTDFSIFRQAGKAGYDLAFVGDVWAYHTRLDSIANSDERSLQHHGSYILGLTRHLGNADLPQLLAETSRGDLVYFNTIGTAMLCYPVGWVLPIALVLAALTIGVLAFGFRRRQLALAGIGKGLLACLSCLGAAVLVVWLVQLLTAALHPGYREMLQGERYNGVLYGLGRQCCSAWPSPVGCWHWPGDGCVPVSRRPPLRCSGWCWRCSVLYCSSVAATCWPGRCSAP